MKNKFLLWGFAGIAVVVIVVFTNSGSSEEIPNSSEFISNEENSIKENGGYMLISVRDQIAGASTNFDFSVSILEGWSVRALAGGEALSIYDPKIEAESNIEQSQIFSEIFVANNFQTPETVNILSRIDRNVNDKSAVHYLIAKKEEAEDFEGQPSWRNDTHKVVTIRASEENPSLFFVFAKSPSLSDAEFQRFLDSIIFN